MGKIKTKERILATALRLFNTRGLARVTLRGIATELGISQGNLSYHFRKREELIEQLYFQLVGQFDALFTTMGREEFDLALALRVNQRTMELLYAYRFLLLDFVQVMRAQPRLRTHYRELGQLRRTQFRMGFARLQERGLVRAEAYEGEFEAFFERLQIFGDFWISHSEIQDELPAAERIQKYARLLLDAFYPYLTERGKETFRALGSTN